MAFTEISAVIFVRTFSVDVSAKSGEIEIRLYMSKVRRLIGTSLFSGVPL